MKSAIEHAQREEATDHSEAVRMRWSKTLSHTARPRKPYCRFIVAQHGSGVVSAGFKYSGKFLLFFQRAANQELHRNSKTNRQ
jgi:hypothetical protein